MSTHSAGSIESLRTVLQRLAPQWGPYLKKTQGLDIEADDLEAELARPLDVDRSVAGFEDFRPGATRGVEPGDPASSLLYHALAADSAYGAWMKQLEFPADSGLLDTLPQPEQLPAWLSEDEFAVYLESYRTSGFRGPNNWYRNIPNMVADTPELEGARFTRPAAFVAGAQDDVLLYDPDWRTHFPDSFDDLRFIDIIDGAGHWLQVEKPAETTASMLKFLQQVR